MFFEGAEKKLEISLTPKAVSLRQRELAFWTTLVACANAEILSKISNKDCDAYLLSESSLFVWDNKILILTCGNSTLIEAACYFINSLGGEHIAALCYQRKNEYQAQLQSTTFAEDIAQLRTLISGQAFRVGHLDAHHHYVFCAAAVPITQVGTRLELMMYHIRGELAEYLNDPVQTEQGIVHRLKLTQLFPEFQLDMHCFKPTGFSLNAIQGRHYFTLHITPSAGQGDHSYVSFETNLNLAAYPYPVVAQLISLFAPSSWDLVSVNQLISTAGLSEHLCVGHCSLTTEQGNYIDFNHYQQRQTEELLPEFM